MTDNCDFSEIEIGPASLDFEIAGYVPSNIKITQIKVTDSLKQATTSKWVRLITVPEHYTFDIPKLSK